MRLYITTVSRFRSLCARMHCAPHCGGQSHTDSTLDPEILLSRLQESTSQEVRALADKHPEVLSLDYLLWIADREAASGGDKKARLTQICGQLVAIRLGIDSASLDITQAEIAAAQAAEPSRLPDALRRLYLPDTLQDQQDDIVTGLMPATDVEQRRQALARHQIGSALSVEQAAAAEEQVAALMAGIHEQKVRSGLQLMGRKELDPADAALPLDLGEADAAERILQVLLDAPDALSRQLLLPEAFEQAPAGSEAAHEDPDVDLLSTSPLRLLQAIDRHLTRPDSLTVQRELMLETLASSRSKTAFKASSAATLELLSEDCAALCSQALGLVLHIRVIRSDIKMAKRAIFVTLLLLALLGSSTASRQLLQNSPTPDSPSSPSPTPASPSPTPASPSPSPASASPSPTPGKCYYGNSDVPLYCDSPSPPPAPVASPPPPHGKCYYGNSDVPLYCDSPSPVASPPPPPPKDNNCFYGNSDIPLPAAPGSDKVLVEAADDFFTTSAVTIQGVTFEGLLPAAMTPENQGQYITSIGALLYAVYPQNSNPAVDGTKVASREGSPADTNIFNITTAAFQLTKLSDDIVTMPVIQDYNIEPVPNQLQTDQHGVLTYPPAISGKRYEIFVPFQYNLPAGAHVFVVPQVGIDCHSATPYAEHQCGFAWSSAPYPVSYANQVCTAAGHPIPSMDPG
ncbi:hypothetical protein WJX73_009667 [Symbiochloris irregularis]|uniref:Uncharacterized protein n=1 Tax=Symbiochloris irregularis TaxID=706552 RepID=A0AAW1Q468_9CHLO